MDPKTPDTTEQSAQELDSKKAQKLEKKYAKKMENRLLDQMLEGSVTSETELDLLKGKL